MNQQVKPIPAQDLKTINNEIAESYCSFGVSKLLKEKGFDCLKIGEGEYFGVHSDGRIHDNGDECCEYHIKKPTHALAIEWLRVNFGIWIYLNILVNVSNYNHREVFSPAVVKGLGLEMKFECFDSPQEATEAALLYTLKNLIP